ncbi:GT4 family glycosyltransferase PelF [Crossiella sp. CA-258035]|uniref:GT4 family glycosyltransferase PelF n=1 Tax=Crossiella sp. CA-258035 TaxID=2981138 RepID=UPI0024BCD1EB|nr:GT4 family glycosyltransferase PelF [Crossiella sp. CA-258035]WHT21601.1 GT4 family glycosyltransferase PelF [Crossiella sp. CA-258035]
MDVALMTEGTYPHSFGGVSVWCDQLVRGLPQHRFHLLALVSTGQEPTAWELPPNVASLTLVPLWGADHHGRRPGRRALRGFGELFRELLATLTVAGLPDKAARFTTVLRALFDYSQRSDLSASLRDEDAVRAMMAAWRDWPEELGKPPTVADAVTAVELLEHSLRPLAAPPVLADVSHCVANGLAALPALTANWCHQTPLLLTEHGIYLRERYLGYRSSPYRHPVKALHLAFFRQVCELAYRTAALVAPGNIYNKRWEERLGTDPALIRTVYNGVDPADFPAVEAEPEVPTLSWAGRVDPIKDLETLIKAFALVCEQVPKVRLRLFGGTPKGGETYANRCKELANSLGVGDRVIFEGRVEDIRDAYVAGHVVVLSSISEGFPYTLIEAMTVGRACVATDVGGVPEAVGDTGIVVPPRDPAAMAQACVRLLADRDLRHAMAAAARHRALELFTVDKAVGTFDELYTGLGVVTEQARALTAAAS